MIARIEPRLTVATSQFPVTGDVAGNGRTVCRHIELAASRGADVVLFPESALTGYPGADLDSFDGFDWCLLRETFESVRAAAKRHRCWTLVGSAHPVSDGVKPMNCVYVIDNQGRVRTRYDKAMLYKSEAEHFSAGSSPTVFRIGSIRCGVLICFDSCFPELYSHMERERVRILFHPYYNAARERGGMLDELMPSQVRARAHDHSFLIVASNSCRRHSSMPSCIAGPDGRFATLRRHTPGVLVEPIAADDPLWRFRRESSPGIRSARKSSRRAPRHVRIEDKRALP